MNTFMKIAQMMPNECVYQRTIAMIIGYAGADSIEFVLKPDDDAVYAYYPIEDRLHQMAPDFDTFAHGWVHSEISV